MKYLAALTILVLTMTAYAVSEEQGQKKDRVGPDKAVLEASDELGIRVAPATLELLEIKTKVIESASKISLPASSFVKFQDFTAIYRERKGWLRMVEIEPEVKGDIAFFSTPDLQPGDQVVIHNAPLLRVIDLDIFGPEADACAD